VTKQRASKAKDGATRKPDRVPADVISNLLGAANSGRWQTPFQAECLRRYHLLGKRVIGHSELLARSGAIPRIDAAPEVLHAIFATNRPDHAFDQEPLRWGFGLTEPMATRTLAMFLSAGSVEMRALRISAFLQAIGIPEDCASPNALQRCRVVAEEDRIDLKLVWKGDDGKDIVVIIEAKLGHEVTEGQLSGYRAIIRRSHGCAPISSVLLTLDNSACAALKGMQRRIWRQVDWRNFWLRFERLRPIEHNPSLQMFLNTLWHRTGRLTQENRNGPI